MKKLIILLLLLSTGYVFSQEQQDSAKTNWTELGFGIDNNGISGQFSINWSSNGRLYRLRYIGSAEIFILGSMSPRETMNDIGILYGKAFCMKNVRCIVSGGVGMVIGKKRGDFLHSDGAIFGTEYYNEKRIVNIGIPLEIECKLLPLKNVGIGMGVYANLNLDKPLFGMQGKIYLH
jgi:hypothetical protein